MANLNSKSKIVQNYLVRLQYLMVVIFDREMKESGFDYFCIGIDIKNSVK
jgi:hypothetical protein